MRGMIAQTTSPHKALASRIRDERQARGLSLRDMAEASGVSFATLQRVETGRRDLRISTLFAIAETLGVPVAGFLGDHS